MYTPKTSSEYNSIAYSLHSAKNHDNNSRASNDRIAPTLIQGSYSSYKERSDNEWKKNNKQTLVDYKDFDR